MNVWEGASRSFGTHTRMGFHYLSLLYDEFKEFKNQLMILTILHIFQTKRIISKYAISGNIKKVEAINHFIFLFIFKNNINEFDTRLMFKILRFEIFEYS